MAQFENGVLVRNAPLGHYEITVSTSAVGLPNIADAARLRRVLITPRAHGIIWTDDGTTPTATHGQPLAADSTLIYDGTVPEQFQCIRDGSTDVDVRVAYYGL